MYKFIVFILFSSCQFNSQKISETDSLCGANDDRLPSHDQRIGRLRSNLESTAGCTATLISKSCLITAAHCQRHTGIFEINVPPSSETGILTPSAAQFQYSVVPHSIVSGGGRINKDDWMVLKVNKNIVTGKLPGDEFGFFKTDWEKPIEIGLIAEITGHGVAPNVLNATQKMHSAAIESVDLAKKLIYHKIDTTSGDSGAALVDKESQKIFGIHVSGGCDFAVHKSNFAVALYDHLDLQKAINTCLQNDL